MKKQDEWRMLGGGVWGAGERKRDNKEDSEHRTEMEMEEALRDAMLSDEERGKIESFVDIYEKWGGSDELFSKSPPNSGERRAIKSLLRRGLDKGIRYVRGAARHSDRVSVGSVVLSSIEENTQFKVYILEDRADYDAIRPHASEVFFSLEEAVQKARDDTGSYSHYYIIVAYKNPDGSWEAISTLDPMYDNNEQVKELKRAILKKAVSVRKIWRKEQDKKRTEAEKKLARIQDRIDNAMIRLSASLSTRSTTMRSELWNL